MKYPHEENINTKISNNYGNKRCAPLLLEIKKAYSKFRVEMDRVNGHSKGDIKKKVDLLNKYINYISQRRFTDNFTSQSKLRPTIIEEFLIHLFCKLANYEKSRYLIGPTKAYTNLSFSPNSFMKNQVL